MPHASSAFFVSLALVGLTEVIARAVIDGLGGEVALAVALLTLGSTLPLAFLGPSGAALAVSASSVVSLAGFHLLSLAAFTATVVALFRFGRRMHRQRLAETLGISTAGPFVLLALLGRSPSSSEADVLTVLLGTFAPIAFFVGLTRHARREADEHRAVREVITDTLAHHAARGERTRIARELHDVVAHHISMVAVQAEAARLAVPGLPAAAAERLSAIGDTARDALSEMRHLLGVLRDDTGIEVPDRRPQPGLDQLTELVDEARKASGRPTRLILRGARTAVEPNVELVAYRIVQEALTNSRQHAPGAAVDVEVAYADTSMRVRVRDNGPGPPPSAQPGGHGIAGMLERAAAVGGAVQTGPAYGGGYLVEAVLPAKVEEAG